MSKIGTNQMAVNAQKASQQIQRSMTKIMEKLSTGQRINKPNDDPAGLSISTKMTAQIKGFQAASKNINDAIAMVQTIDGALGEQITLLQRMRELAVQSSTDTFSAADRTMMETEYDQLVAELDRIDMKEPTFPKDAEWMKTDEEIEQIEQEQKTQINTDKLRQSLSKDVSETN